jgi:hypothetical protein
LLRFGTLGGRELHEFGRDLVLAALRERIVEAASPLARTWSCRRLRPGRLARPVQTVWRRQ